MKCGIAPCRILNDTEYLYNPDHIAVENHTAHVKLVEGSDEMENDEQRYSNYDE